MHLKELRKLTAISLVGPTDHDMVKGFDQRLKELLETEKLAELVIFLTTTGGSVAYADGVRERIRLLQKLTKVTLVGIGSVMSAGVHIALSVPKKQRLLTSGTLVYIHQPHPKWSPQLSNIPIEAVSIILQELQTDAEDDRRYWQNHIKAIARESHRKVREIERIIRSGHFLKGKEAVDFGLFGGLLEED